MLSLTLLGLLILGSARCESSHEGFRIYNADDFIAFSNEVNSKSRFKGTTVYLEGDIDFSAGGVDKSDEFYTIGNDTSLYFEGTFNGQGYAIRNLKMNSSNTLIGLFGYSRGSIFHNVVLDSTCGITATLHSVTYVSSIIANCYGTYRECTIHSSVNMATLNVVSESTQTSAYVGGLAGRIYTLSHFDLSVKNCANYGNIVSTASISSAYIGGLVGGISLSQASESELSSIRDNLNYGDIQILGPIMILHAGGIAGWAEFVSYENSVSAGHISVASSTSSTMTGGIAGKIFSSYTIFRHSFWDGGDAAVTGYSNILGKIIAGTATVAHSDAVDIDEGLAAEIAGYDTTVKNVWIHNPAKKNIAVKLTGAAALDYAYEFVVVPEPTSKWRNFLGWYSDAALTTPFTGHSVAEDTTLYGYWDKYLVTLDAAGGSVSQTYFEVSFGEKYPAFPEPIKNKATFYGWYTEENGGGDKIDQNVAFTRAFDHTLYAHLVTRTFYAIFVCSSNETIEKEVIYTDPIQYPTTPKREGYRFIGWDQNVTVMPDHNLTINAVWEEITVYVKVVMETGEVSRENVGYYFVMYTDDLFDISYFSYDKSTRKTTVILKFTNVDKAAEFMDAILEEADVAEKINYVPVGSFSAVIKPLSMIFTLLLMYLFI